MVGSRCLTNNESTFYNVTASTICPATKRSCFQFYMRSVPVRVNELSARRISTPSSMTFGVHGKYTERVRGQNMDGFYWRESSRWVVQPLASILSGNEPWGVAASKSGPVHASNRCRPMALNSRMATPRSLALSVPRSRRDPDPRHDIE